MSRTALMTSALLEKADADPILRARLLTQPEKVAEEFKIQLEAAEIAYLKKVGDILTAIGELNAIILKDEVIYPAPDWLNRQLIRQVAYRARFPRDWIFYPVEIGRLREIFNANKLSSRAAAAG